MKFLRKRAAKRFGVPFNKERFWPPFYISFGGQTLNGLNVRTDLYDAFCGDVVPVLEGNGNTHFYRLTRVSCASGSDHIVSPLQFDIEYHSTKPMPGRQEATK